MIQNLRVFAALLVASFALEGCDVLDEQVVSDVTAEAYYTTPAGLRDAVKAAYVPLRTFYGDEQGCTLSVFGTDEYTNGGHGSFQYMNQYTASLNSEAGPIQNLWTNFYRAINTTNAAVGRAQEIVMDAAEKNRLIAEARFLRAHYYFILVQTYGPLHLTLEETIGAETEARRDSEADIYTAIVEDLEFAVANLPNVQTEYGRATKPAAEHMLALVLLTRGYRDFGAPSDFTRAADLAKGVIANYNFRLLDDYAAVFNHDNERHEEVIWAVQYTSDFLTTGTGNRSHLYYRPWYENINTALTRTAEPGYGRPWIRFRPTLWGLENFRPLDVDSRYRSIFQDVWYYNNASRLPAGAVLGDTAIWTPDEPLPDAELARFTASNPGVVVVPWQREEQVINMFPSLRKFDDFKRPTVNEERGSRDYQVYRLAETYLIAAEALLQAGRAGEAADFVNAVRHRAAYPGREAEMTVTAAQIDLDFILDERSRELFGEQKRWFDLKRTGKLLERVRAHNKEARANIQERHLLRPIPADQITRTSNEYAQNPGY